LISEKTKELPEDEGIDDQDWEHFLNFLKSKSRSMFNVLKDWEFQHLTNETLEIGKCSQSFSASYFDDKDKFEELSAYCRDFFQKDIRIKILANNNSLPVKAFTPKKETPKAQVLRKTDLPQPVQDILRLFQGEIKKGHSSA